MQTPKNTKIEHHKNIAMQTTKQAITNKTKKIPLKKQQQTQKTPNTPQQAKTVQKQQTQNQHKKERQNLENKNTKEGKG